MRINIIKTELDADYLIGQAESYESREAVHPYLIMSQRTVNKLMETVGNAVKVDDHGGYEFEDFRILINSDLHFGEVDVR